MLMNDFIAMYRRGLEQCMREVEQFDESILWTAAPGVINTGGNLALHLAGNLQCFIGAELGHTGYIRNRDAEFATRGLSKDTVVQDLQAAMEAVLSTLEKLDDAQLAEAYPIDKFGEGKSNLYVLSYLLAHLNYHVGQMNYLRRILTK